MPMARGWRAARQLCFCTLLRTSAELARTGTAAPRAPLPHDGRSVVGGLGGPGGESPTNELLAALHRQREAATEKLRDRILFYVEVFCKEWSIPYEKGDSVHSYYDDPGSKTPSAQSLDVQGFLEKVVVAFPTAQYNFLGAIQRIGMNAQLKNAYAGAVGSGKGNLRKPFSSWTGFFAGGKHKNTEVKAGGGFGFGFQVYCGCHLILTTGMGFGGGLDSHDTGGLGGGGGLQLYRGGKLQASVGGGGGGNLGKTFGTSEDAGQKTGQSRTMADLKKLVVAPQISSCHPANISVTAGGGAGMGFVIAVAGKTTVYGGGLDMRVSSATFAKNDKACGGKLSRETQQDRTIDDGQKKCRVKCMKDPSTFNTCFCTCTKQAYQQSGQAWAKHMQCSDGNIASMMSIQV